MISYRHILIISNNAVFFNGGYTETSAKKYKQLSVKTYIPRSTAMRWLQANPEKATALSP